MERELANNLFCMNVLGYPKTIPDSSTIWLFRERLKEKDSLDAVRQEAQRQPEAKGLIVKEGSIQDATFIKCTITLISRDIHKKSNIECPGILSKLVIWCTWDISLIILKFY